jgi:FKBP-type peptidyl-prolyl cis-trans isomerase
MNSSSALIKTNVLCFRCNKTVIVKRTTRITFIKNTSSNTNNNTNNADDDDDDAEVDNAVYEKTTTNNSDNSSNNKNKQLRSKGVNLFDPAATLSRALTKRFGIVGGLGLVAVLAVVEGSSIVKSLLEVDKDVSEEKEVTRTLESGLKVKDVRIGGGQEPKKGDFVGIEVKMESYTTNVVEEDKVTFVDTKETKKPIAFIFKSGKPLLTPLCPGMVEGIQSMKRGGIRELIIPAGLGFGDKDVVLPNGKTIPGGTDLLVRITLVDVTNYYQ